MLVNVLVHKNYSEYITPPLGRTRTRMACILLLQKNNASTPGTLYNSTGVLGVVVLDWLLRVNYSITHHSLHSTGLHSAHNMRSYENDLCSKTRETKNHRIITKVVATIEICTESWYPQNSNSFIATAVLSRISMPEDFPSHFAQTPGHDNVRGRYPLSWVGQCTIGYHHPTPIQQESGW